MTFTRSEIPKVENLSKIIKELKSQFEYSLESIQTIESEIVEIASINNQTEKTDYFTHANDEINYLLQDFRMDRYSTLMETMTKLKEFKEILDKFESTDHLFPIGDYQ